MYFGQYRIKLYRLKGDIRSTYRFPAPSWGEQKSIPWKCFHALLIIGIVITNMLLENTQYKLYCMLVLSPSFNTRLRA